MTPAIQQVDGESNFLYRGEKNMKLIEVDMNVEIKVDSFNFVYGVNGCRRFYKFQTKWLNKQRKALIGDIITIINRLRLDRDNEREHEKVHVTDVNIKNINNLKQGVALSCTSKSNDSDDDVFNTLFGLVDTGSDYSDSL